jgi:hypothetical protein
MNKRTVVSHRCFWLVIAFLLMSCGVPVFAEERVCPDGKRAYFGVCPEQSSPSQQRQPEPSSRQPAPPPTPSSHINISGIWRDPTLGTTSQVTQQGETFHFRVWGPSCTGGTFQSSGSGTIRGNVVESQYQALLQSTLRSEGRCSGIVSPDGTRIRSTCNDSVCGEFTSSGVRQ